MNKVSEMMIASTSHDMRTPINTALNMVSLLKKANLSPLESKWLKVAKTSLSLLLSLINDILDYY
jgi:signal transduction histidine kinase